MKLIPLSEITDQIIAALVERTPKASMVLRFGDDSYTLPREVWANQAATGEAKLKIMTEIREGRVTVRTPFGTPSSLEHWADNLDAFSMCMVDEIAAQYLLNLWGITSDEPVPVDPASQPAPAAPKMETETDAKPRRQRSDSLAREISTVIPVIESKGLPVTPNNVMGHLAVRAGKTGSCIQSYDGIKITWKRSNGTTETLGIDGIRGRLDRLREMENQKTNVKDA